MTRSWYWPEESLQYGMAPAHITVFLSQIPSTKNAIIRPAMLFLAWPITFCIGPRCERMAHGKAVCPDDTSEDCDKDCACPDDQTRKNYPQAGGAACYTCYTPTLAPSTAGPTATPTGVPTTRPHRGEGGDTDSNSACKSYAKYAASTLKTVCNQTVFNNQTLALVKVSSMCPLTCSGAGAGGGVHTPATTRPHRSDTDSPTSLPTGNSSGNGVRGTSAPTSPEMCVDAAEVTISGTRYPCGLMKRYCTVRPFGALLKTNCPKTCGICKGQEMVTTAWMNVSTCPISSLSARMATANARCCDGRAKDVSCAAILSGAMACDIPCGVELVPTVYRRAKVYSLV